MADRPESVELSPVPDVFDVLQLFAQCHGLVLFESVRRHSQRGRYSFLAAEPIQLWKLDSRGTHSNPLTELRQHAEQFRAETVADLPPFQGGYAGILSYELGSCWERLPLPTHDEFQIPVAAIGCYNWVIAWDHLAQRCWVISHGHPAISKHERRSLARSHCHRIAEALARDDPSSIQQSRFTPARNIVEIATPAYAVGDACGVHSNFSAAMYRDAVQQVIDNILAGDIFQANLSQRLIAKTSHSPLQNYAALRTHNPAPFAGLMQCDDWAVLSSSPERFLQMSGNRIGTRPIKGTRQRHVAPEADLYARDELRESDKDLAENVMIVDLLRNDLSRVCQPGTIRVPELCSIESYETVTHLVSEVTGVLRDDMTFWDAIQAAFPGGSITGAPKIRAMEIISELEQVARGPYCGSLFYCGFDGTADSNLLIRTAIQRGGQLAFPVGGGIVAQSHPQHEYEETLHKAAGMIAALTHS